MSPIETLQNHIEDIESILEENIDYYEQDINVLNGIKNLLRLNKEMCITLKKFNNKMWDDTP